MTHQRFKERHTSREIPMKTEQKTIHRLRNLH